MLPGKVERFRGYRLAKCQIVGIGKAPGWASEALCYLAGGQEWAEPFPVSEGPV